MLGMNGPELLIILLVILLLFGGTKLPKLARSLGSASKEFKAGVSEGEREAEAEALKTEQLKVEQAKTAEK